MQQYGTASHYARDAVFVYTKFFQIDELAEKVQLSSRHALLTLPHSTFFNGDT